LARSQTASAVFLFVRHQGLQGLSGVQTQNKIIRRKGRRTIKKIVKKTLKMRVVIIKSS